MAVLGRTYLGIEINASEIHIAEVQGSWPQIHVLRSHVGGTPPGLVEGGHVMDAAALGDTLREMLHTMKAGTRDAVIGLPIRALLTRTLDIPRVPANEMRIIISGELSHYQALCDNADTFDFTPLPGGAGEQEGGQSVLVMAAEKPITDAYNEAADRAGLRLLALEPLPIALLRSLSISLQSEPDALCVFLQHGDVEIAIVENGALRLYRRLDISSSDLIGKRTDSPAASAARGAVSAPKTLSGDFEPEEAPVYAPLQSVSLFDSTAAQSLTLEIQRSLEYYSSQFSPEHPIRTVLIASAHPELDTLPQWLSNALDLSVIPASLPEERSPVANTPFDLPVPSDRRLGAVGLAMRELPGLPPALPRMSLTRSRRPAATEKTLRQRLTGVLAASILILVCSTAFAYRIGLRANRLEHAVHHLKEDIEAMQQDKQNRLDGLQTRTNLLRTLSQEGFDFPRYMDSIAGAVSPEAGLVEITLNRGGQFSISGEAENEKAIITTLEGLKRSPYLLNTSLTSFDSIQNQVTQLRLLRFQITSQLAGSAPAQTASSSSPGAARSN